MLKKSSFAILIKSLLIVLVVGCSSNPDRGDSANRKQVESNSSASKNKKVSQVPAEGAFHILQNIPYANNGGIADNVKNECTKLGEQFSNSIKKYASKHGIMITQVADSLPNKGKSVVLSIDNVYSAGNAFLGHRKSATVKATLMLDGKEIASTSKTRNSGGGFMGGFKGSCSVLAHTVNTLGSDIDRWLSEQ